MDAPQSYPVYQQTPACGTCYQQYAVPEWWTAAAMSERVKPVTVFCHQCKTTATVNFFQADWRGRDR